MALLAHLKEFESFRVLDIEARSAGTILPGEIHIQGNSILSSVFVTAIDPGMTLKINYFDTSSGTFDRDMERFELDGHDLIDDSITVPLTQRLTVTRIHNKPQIEVVITGAGTVTFGLYFTVVSSFATDLDAALIREGDTFVPTDTRAIPIACLDETAGTLHFLRCDGGSLSVSETLGDKNDFTFDGTSTPGVEQDLVDETLSATLRTFVRHVRVACRNHGNWKLLNDTTMIAAGLTGPAMTNDDYTFNIPYELAPSENLTLKFTGLTGDPASMLRAFVQTEQKV